MRGSRGSQTGPPELVFHGWLRYFGPGTIRLGRTIGTKQVSVWILRVLGQPFGNQHRVCLLESCEAQGLLSKLESNGQIPLPVTLRCILFSLQPGTDVYLLGSHDGVHVHASDEAMTESASMREAIDRLVEEEIGRLNPEAVKQFLQRAPKAASVG